MVKEPLNCSFNYLQGIIFFVLFISVLIAKTVCGKKGYNQTMNVKLTNLFANIVST